MCFSISTNLFYLYRRNALIHGGQRVETPWPPDVHPLPDPGAGERVPHKPLPHTEAADRNGTPGGNVSKLVIPDDIGPSGQIS